MKRFLILFCAILLSACANKSITRYKALEKSYKNDNFEEVIQTIKKEQKSIYGSNSEFLYYLDLGVLYHYARDFEESKKALHRAAEIYENLFARSVTNEAAALLTNDNTRPYRARPFELLLLYEYQILNYLAQGKKEEALVEVRRAQIAMEALYQKDNKKVNDNGFLRYLSAITYELAGETDDAAIAYYETAKAYNESVHPLPSEVFGFISERLIAEGREDDFKKLGKAPNASARAQESRSKGQEIIVIAYGGRSPILGELYMSGTYVNGGALNLTYKDGNTGKTNSFTMVALPMPNVTNGNTFHIGFSLPEKKQTKSQVHGFSVSLNGNASPIESVLDSEKELDQNLKDDWSSTVGRTALRVALRTFAAQTAKELTNTENSLFNFVKNLGTDIAQSQLEQADLRLGLFFPHNIYMTRLPVDEGSHSVEVTSLSKNGTPVRSYKFNNISVKRGSRVFLFVPAVH